MISLKSFQDLGYIFKFIFKRIHCHDVIKFILLIITVYPMLQLIFKLHHLSYIQTISSSYKTIRAHRFPLFQKYKTVTFLVFELFPVRNLAADPLLYNTQDLTICQTHYFFLLSQHSHLSLFHLYAVANVLLSSPSNSMSFSMHLTIQGGMVVFLPDNSPCL